MDDKLYTIPVKEALETDCECCVCKMYEEIEKNAIEFTMGPSYMEDDIRFQTDEKGFCNVHSKKLYEYNNRLGLGIIMNTHLQRTVKDIEKLSSGAKGGGFFKKKDYSDLINYIKNLNNSCFVCERINNTFDRYIATIFHLWKNDKDFVAKYSNCKGFCTNHFGLLVEEAKNNLMGSSYEDFLDKTIDLYLSNMKRVNGDVDWFVDKFDYRFKDEPWKNSKDALPRCLIKTNSINVEE
ncbi:MAG: hypothetical protein E7254_04000 [Lachnospiraceae bacterium]|nr:hypothetical protein [Lachnospiraceae bacterium]